MQAAINAAGNFLPTDLPTPPIYNKVNPADAPILTLALTSKTLPLPKVEDLADTRLAQKISQLPGVGLVSISGGQRPAVRIQANPTALAAYGLALDDVRTAIGNANVNQAKGSFDGPTRASTIDANDQLKSADEYQQLIIAYRTARRCACATSPTSIDGAENVAARRVGERRRRRSSSTSSASPAPTSSRSSTAIKQLLPQLQASLPAAVDVTLLTDRTVDHPRVGARRAVRAAARRRAGRDGDLPVPAQRAGDGHPERRGAAVAGRHVRRHVPRRLQRSTT